MYAKLGAKLPLLFFLPLCHAVNDCIGGYLIARYDSEYAIWSLLLFNVFGFGFQLPFGYLTDRFFSPISVLKIALCCSFISLVAFSFFPFCSLTLCGIASGLFHVSAGSIVLKTSNSSETSTWLGAFTAPGVVGLALGGYAGKLHWDWDIALMIISAATILSVFLLRNSFQQSSQKTVTHAIDKHDLIMILLILVIAFRSAAWNIYQLIYDHDLEGLILLAIAAALGKIFGGWIASKIPTKYYCMISAVLSTLLLGFGSKYLWATLSGIFLLQSVTPIVYHSIHRQMPEKTATSSGLALGAAIAIGGFSNVLLPQSNVVMMLGILCIALYSFTPKKYFGAR